MSYTFSMRPKALKSRFTNTPTTDVFRTILVNHGRAKIKWWTVFFTCFNISAIHIELVEGLNIDNFIKTLGSFINRRRRPENIASDCGTTFEGTVSKLIINPAKVNEFVVKDVFMWDFNPTALHTWVVFRGE